MVRRLTVSALLVTGLFAVSAVGQPPGGADRKQPPAEKVQPANPTDAAVAAALSNDPDVKVARAKAQLAEAELAKAKQAVVLKVMTLLAAIKEHKIIVEQCQERAAWADRMLKQAFLSAAQAQAERSKLESAQAALAKLEMELKLLTGGDGKEFKMVELPGGDADAVARGLAWLMKAQQDNSQAAILEYMRAVQLAHEKVAVKGPIPERIRAALDKPVKLGAKGEKVTFEQALEVFKKEAGLDVPVRGVGDLVRSPVLISQGEELPVGAWLQLYQDYAAGGSAGFYVRDYGLLFTDKTAAPPDAPTVTEFWKQKPPEKKAAAPGAKEGK